MGLIRLIYSSHAGLDLRLSDVKQILETARSKNYALGVCGMLFYNSKYFLQALEGEEQTVQHIYNKIADDFRHDDLQVISQTSIEDTLFSHWAMGYAGNSKAVDDTLSNMGLASDDFTQLNPDQCLQLLIGAGQHQQL